MNICIYGSASRNLDPIYIDACRELGKCIGERGHGLVFGGSSRGLMGATAEGVSLKNGDILGIAPRFMDEQEGNRY